MRRGLFSLKPAAFPRRSDLLSTPKLTCLYSRGPLTPSFPTSETSHQSAAMVRILDSITRISSWSTAFQVPTRPQQSDSSILPLHGKIPGGSPLEYCNVSHATDLYQIDRIELYPNPLHIDDVFQVHLYGTFLKNITDNATLAYTARYGNSSEFESGTLDWCKGFIDSIDQPDPHRQHDCPPEKGFGLIMMSSWVWPMFIVPGPYHFEFDARTKEGERIYCLQANIFLDYEQGAGHAPIVRPGRGSR